MRLAIAVTLKASAWAEVNRSAIWSAIRAAKGRLLTVAGLAAALDTKRERDLRRFLDDAAELRHAEGGYEVLEAAPDIAEPIAGRRMQQMWNILRGPQARRGITPAELALWSSTDVVSISAKQAEAYLAALAASHFVRLDKGLYRLPADRNTGPLAPRLMRASFVVDPNGISVSAAPIVAEEAPL